MPAAVYSKLRYPDSAVGLIRAATVFRSRRPVSGRIVGR